MNLYKCILKDNDCYKTGATIQPKGIVVHSTGANNPTIRRYVQPSKSDPNYDELLQVIGVNKNGNSWNRSGVSKCVHAFVGKLADGSVGTVQTLPWTTRGWHAGNGTTRPSANNTHISFEICEDGLTDETYFKQVYQEAIELVAYLCQLYELDPTNPEVVLCHKEASNLGMASNHADVLHWFPKFGKSMDDFRADVAAFINQPKEDEALEQFTELWNEMRKTLQTNDASEYSKDAREWAIAKGIVKGGSSDEFNGMWHDFPTREQLVTMLYRFAQSIGEVK